MAILVTVLAGGTIARGQHSIPARVGIYVEFEEKPSPVAVEVMQTETQALLLGAGLQPAWRFLKRTPRTENEKFDSVVVVRFKGSCRPVVDTAGTEWEPFAEQVRLAATKTRSGQVLPITEVECDNIGRAIRKLPLKQRGPALGSALGRVVAHELYHILLNTTGHAAKGIARPVVNWDDLVARKATFTAGDLERLSRSLRSR
ncbi:MAG: hypothetical protein IT168_06090 [Bryobacterales bacterium]|nr:hypothetical protein [Bryobacterales bacterium]